LLCIGGASFGLSSVVITLLGFVGDVTLGRTGVCASVSRSGSSSVTMGLSGRDLGLAGLECIGDE